MKLKFKNKKVAYITAETPVQEDNLKDVFVPVERLHEFYPLDICFQWRYTLRYDSLKLGEVMRIEGRENPYESGITLEECLLGVKGKPRAQYTDYLNLKRSDVAKAVKHPNPIAKHNVYVMGRAAELGLPMFGDNISVQEAIEAFEKINELQMEIRSTVTDRMIESIDRIDYLNQSDPEESDVLLFKYMTKDEEREMRDLGYIFTMVQVLLKIANAPEE